MGGVGTGAAVEQDAPLPMSVAPGEEGLGVETGLIPSMLSFFWRLLKRNIVFRRIMYDSKQHCLKLLVSFSNFE